MWCESFALHRRGGAEKKEASLRCERGRGEKVRLRCERGRGEESAQMNHLGGVSRTIVVTRVV
eukprot:gene7500-biopygen18050